MSTDDTTSTTVDGTSMAFVANKKKDSWRTPPALYEPIAEAVDGIDLDPCAGPPGDRLRTTGRRRTRRRPSADRYRRPEHHAVGGRPLDPVERGRRVREPALFGRGRWLATAIGAWVAGDAGRVFFVTAANTGTLSWYHRWIASFASVTYFTGPRQNYIDPETGELASGVSFNTAVSVFGTIPESLAEYWKEEGDLVVRPWNAGGIVADSDRGEP